MARAILKILTTDTAKVIVKKHAAELGMKEMIVAGRVYEWFARQDEVIVKGILGLLPKGYEGDLVKLALDRIAKDAGGKSKGK